MINKIQAKSVLKRNAKHIDDWFCGSYSIAPYYGCQHACVYCDGRYEKYGFEGKFGEDVSIKVNTLELLRKEINKVREPGYTFIGSGITDAYQPIEKKYMLTRHCIELIKDNPMLSLHILTKSALVERDLDLIFEISKKRKAIISFSIAFDNEVNKKLFEPRTSPLSERWRILKKARELGINTGVYIIPIVPFISDTKYEIEAIVNKCIESKVDFVMFGGLTLKIGRQKDFYLEFIKNKFPNIYNDTVQIYSNSAFWGEPKRNYSLKLYSEFSRIAAKYKLKIRIPQYLLTNAMPKYYEASLILSHIYAYLQNRNIKRDSYRYASYAIQKWVYEQKKGIFRKKDFNYLDLESKFLELIKSGKIKSLGSIGDTIYSMLLQFAEKGRIDYYVKLVNYQ